MRKILAELSVALEEIKAAAWNLAYQTTTVLIFRRHYLLCPQTVFTPAVFDVFELQASLKPSVLGVERFNVFERLRVSRDDEIAGFEIV